jgi:hypothetical protein
MVVLTICFFLRQNFSLKSKSQNERRAVQRTALPLQLIFPKVVAKPHKASAPYMDAAITQQVAPQQSLPPLHSALQI